MESPVAPQAELKYLRTQLYQAAEYGTALVKQQEHLKAENEELARQLSSERARWATEMSDVKRRLDKQQLSRDLTIRENMSLSRDFDEARANHGRDVRELQSQLRAVHMTADSYKEECHSVSLQLEEANAKRVRELQQVDIERQALATASDANSLQENTRLQAKHSQESTALRAELAAALKIAEAQSEQIAHLSDCEKGLGAAMLERIQQAASLQNDALRKA
jgi:hypothetical protein